MSGWQPIETAPERGAFLAWNKTRGVLVARRCPTWRTPTGIEALDPRILWTHGWIGMRPTHWMPLPEPPEADRV